MSRPYAVKSCIPISVPREHLEIFTSILLHHCTKCRACFTASPHFTPQNQGVFFANKTTLAMLTYVSVAYVTY